MENIGKIGLTAAAVAFVAVCASAQTSAGPLQVTLDGRPVTFDAAQPQMVSGRVLVPLRGVFEKMGANVEWNESTQSVLVDGAGRIIRLKVGSFDAEINGRVVTMDIAPQLIDGSTMIPLRFLSQSLGERVDWQPQNNLVAITGLPHRAQRFRDRDDQEQTPPPPAPTPVIINPPPVIVQAPAPPAPERRRETVTISRDNVIPMRLDADLSSNANRPGDRFVATVTGDGGPYMNFPEGTVVEGYVRNAIPAAGSHGGTLDVRFTHIKFPDGSRYPITGAFAPLDNRNIIRTGEGRYVIRGGRDSVVAQDAAIGAGAGLIIGSFNGRAVGGAILGGSIGALVGAFDHSLAHNVIFPAGTRFGLILGENLTVDRRDLRN